MNEAAAGVAPFHAMAINRLANERERRGLPVVHMEVGQPAAGAPRPAIEAGLRALVTEPQGYWESGALAHRIAAHYRECYGLAIDPARILLTPGASGALVLAIAVLFRHGDRVALPRPAYPAHRNVLRALGLEVLELPCGEDTRYQPTAAMLEALDPAPAGVILTSPSNPTGTMLSPAELAAIAGVCRRRGIRIVSDETYHGISYGPRAHSLLEWDGDAVVVNSFSKYWCMTGWRLGWAAVPAPLVDVMRRFAGNLFLVPPTLSQHVALAAMDARPELEAHVATYAANRRLLTSALPALGIPHFAPADGAFYVYADIGQLTDDSLAWCLELLDATGVALNTGLDFDPVHGGRFVRLSFAVSTAEVELALACLSDWLGGRRRA
ncbi:MAG TPA: aminotransferase class I/II-fold pyridoxal phosphate-dependent enzyme [Steroidobacteraceae bacterium]|nr:aminotransferase class I/II-fold pyridoxal phosphate-dependent enzyme [Steroidobacteraceae bacterium]